MKNETESNWEEKLLRLGFKDIGKIDDLHNPTYKKIISSHNGFSINAIFQSRMSFANERELIGVMTIELVKDNNYNSDKSVFKNDHFVLLQKEDVNNPSKEYMYMLQSLSNFTSDIDMETKKEIGYCMGKNEND